MRLFKSVTSVYIIIGLFAIAGTVLVLAPREVNHTKAENCTIYNYPVFNPFPVTWANQTNDCEDFPVLAGNVDTGSNWSDNFFAQPGDIVKMQIYVHNGAVLNPGHTTMYGVRATTNIPSAAGSQHVISTTLSADNADPKTGLVTIRTPAGSRLELVSGNPNPYIGNLEGGFAFARTFEFTLRIIGPEQATSGNIEAQLGAQIPSQCLYNGLVTWSTSGVNGAEVTVKAGSGEEVLYSRDLNGTSQTPWLTPSTLYTFSLYNVSSSQRQLLDMVVLNVPALDCVGTDGKPKPSGQIRATLGGRIAGQCLYTGTINWSSQNTQSAEVTVRDPLTGDEVLHSYDLNGTSQTPWLVPNRNYRFTLWDTSAGARERLVETWLNVPALDCAEAPPAQIDYTLTINKNNFCVGETPLYTIRGNAAAANKTILWSSYKNGVATGETDYDYGFKTDGAGNWQEYGSTWNVSHIGAWKKVANIQGVKKEVSFTVSNCAPPPTLTCSPASQTVLINQTAQFTASGGTGTYSWTAAGGNPASGSGRNFVTKYASAGSKTVVVQSGNQTANCSVRVNEPLPSTLTCSPASQTVLINQTAQFTASGGTGSFTWSATGGSPASGSGSQFSTKYGSSGNKIVTLTSGSQSATCSVRVNEPSSSGAEMLFNKTVRNVSGGGEFAQSISARQNDEVEYKISVRAAGSVNLKDVRVTDQLPSGVRYVEGSMKVNGQRYAPGFTSGGLVFSGINQSGATITYRVTVTASTGTLTNLARATADNAASREDRAYINVTPTTPGQPTLSIIKEVKNLGPSQTTDFAVAVRARKDDSVQYKITVRNAGGAAAENVVLNDFNPFGSNVSSLSVSKTYSGSLSSGIRLGNLAPNETVIIIYQAPVSITQGTIQNTAAVSAQNAISAQASATVNVVVEPSVFRQLAITKLVRSTSSGAFTKSISVNTNDVVEFEIIVRNVGNQAVNNVRLSDNFSGNLSLMSGTMRIDGNSVSDNLSNISLGSILSGNQKRITFSARVVANSNQSIQNVARAWGDGAAQVQDDAWLFVRSGGTVAGGNVRLIYSKRAFNDTRNADAAAVIANREDYITYTLTVTNTGDMPANNFVITDDLSQVLPYADMVDRGGGVMSSNSISYSGLSVPPGGSVSKSFRVRVKFHLAPNQAYSMTNTYGNTVTVRINQPQVQPQVLGRFVAPKTGGPSVTVAAVFGSLMVGALVVIRNRRKIWELLWD